MSDFSYIKPVVDLTCWTEQETEEVIKKLDDLIKINQLPEDGTLVLRYVLVKLLDMPEDVNPKTKKPDEVFNKLAALSTAEDLTRLFGARVGAMCEMLCYEY